MRYEKDFLRQCVEYLQVLENQKKLAWYRVNNTGIYDEEKKIYRKHKLYKKGISDLLIFINGKALFVELKSDKGTQTDDQKIFEANVNIYGNKEYYCIKKLEELIKIIDKSKK